MKLTKFIMGALAAAVVAPAANAAFISNYAPGDVIIGFRAAAGQGATQTIMANLGAASGYRDTTVDLLNIGSLGSLLSTTYGSNWNERTDLWVGFVAATNGNPVDDSGSVGVGQDPNSTVYVSIRRTAIGTPGNANSTRPGNTIPLDGALTTPGGLINALGNYFNTVDVNGVVDQPASATNSSWNQYVTGSTSVDFGLINVESAYTTGARGNFAAAGSSEALLDFYRVPEFVGGNATGTDGVGSYEGTFSINSSGDVSFIVVPEPSTYALFGLSALGLAAAVIRRKKTANI